MGDKQIKTGRWGKNVGKRQFAETLKIALEKRKGTVKME